MSGEKIASTAEAEERAAQPASGADQVKIRAAIDFLTRNLDDPTLTPSSVAAHAGLDLCRFCRLFKRTTGVTCGRYIAVKRMWYARRLLARRDLLVKEIAYQVGFEDANYFSRRFKGIVGTSPTSYRRGNSSGKLSG